MTPPNSRCTATLPVAVLAIAGVVPGTASAEAPRLRLGVGAALTTGDQGGEDSVDEFYLPVPATVDFARLALRLTVPFLSVRVPELTTISGPDGQPVIGEGPATPASGLGDVLASITVFNLLSAGASYLVTECSRVGASFEVRDASVPDTTRSRSCPPECPRVWASAATSSSTCLPAWATAHPTGAAACRSAPASERRPHPRLRAAGARSRSRALDVTAQAAMPL